MSQKGERRQYKEYISSLRRDKGDITYNDVRSYWSKNDGRPTVWDIIEPLRICSNEDREMLRQMRILLEDIQNASNTTSKTESTDPIEDSQKDDPPSCGENMSANHMNCVSVEETLFIIWLATVSEEKRKNIVMESVSSASDIVRKQVVKEADMIASAIEVSDQLTSI